MLRVFAVLTFLIFISASSDAHASAAAGSDSVNIDLETGAYLVSYHHDEGTVLVRNRKGMPAAPALAITPGGNDPMLRFLAPANVTEVEAVGNKAIVIKGKLNWCIYVVTVSTFMESPHLVNSRIEVVTTSDLQPQDVHNVFGRNNPELSFVDSALKVQPRSAFDATYYFNGTRGARTYHTRVPRTGMVYDLNQFVFFGDSTALGSTFHYFVDFSSLSEFYSATGTRILDTVTQPPGCLALAEGTADKPMVFGYDIPGLKKTLSAGTSLLLANSYIYIEPGVPSINQPVDYCLRFIEGYATIYPHIRKPEPRFVDWPDLTEKGLADILKCQERLGHNVISPQTNLWSIRRYVAKFPSQMGRSFVFDDETRWSRMQAGLPYGDAWQYLFAYAIAGEYSEDFDCNAARDFFLDGADDVVRAGRRLNYVFPLRIDAEFTNEGKWLNEYDCTGAYVFLTLLYFKETGDEVYLREARRAADVLLNIGFEFPYEFTTTALGPIGLLRLFRLTNDRRYLDACAIPIAAILRHSWAFNPGYREYEGRNIFLLTEGMPGVYSNGWEEAALLRYLYLFLKEGQGVVPQRTLDIVSELLRWKGMNVADSLVPLYADKSIVYTGKPREFSFPVVHQWYTPVEGFGYLEWDDSGLHDKPGRVSQSPYCFGALPEAAMLMFHPIAHRATLHVEAPIAFKKESESTYSFRVLGGLQDYKLAIKKNADGDIIVASATGNATEFSNPDTGGWSWATVSPNTEYRITASFEPAVDSNWTSTGTRAD